METQLSSSLRWEESSKMGGGGGGMGWGGVGPGAGPQPEFESNLENVAVHIFPAPPVTHSQQLCMVGPVRTYSK